MLARAGLAAGHGEPGFSAFERATHRPAVVTTDLYTSGGGRTVVPAWAAADLSVRLAAGQEPGTIPQVLRRHLRSRMPPGMSTAGHPEQLRALHAASAGSCRARGARGLPDRVGCGPVLLPSGGSIPFVSTLAAAQRIDVALLGFGLPDDAIHAPNERFYLPNLFRGTDTCIELYQHLGLGWASRNTSRPR